METLTFSHRAISSLVRSTISDYFSPLFLYVYSPEYSKTVEKLKSCNFELNKIKDVPLDNNIATATSRLVDSLKTVNTGVIHIGNILVIKQSNDENSEVIVTKLSDTESIYINDNPEVLSEPSNVLKILSNYKFEEALSPNISHSIIYKYSQSALYAALNKNLHIPKKFSDVALFKLRDYALSVKPNYIIGINRGGSMVASSVSLQLGLPSSSSLSCFVENDELSFPSETLFGTILVIDDICRTGSTLSTIHRYIHENLINNEVEVLTATLFMFMDNKCPIFNHINFYSYEIDKPNAILPWKSHPIQKQRYKTIKKDELTIPKMKNTP